MKDYKEVPNLSHARLAKWWERQRNVLVIGDHGVGKTSVFRQFWDGMGVKYAIFSGATLDPWTDLVGIPRPVQGEDGLHYIEYVLPKTVDEDIEAIYFDEFNRSHPKVRNALLELIQFKSINGRKFPNLKVVWASANSADSDFDYDVEEIDPAQEDRFHVIIKLATNIDLDYFTEKFGSQIANAAKSWWDSQSREVKQLISPRRLDYAVEDFVDGEPLRDSLPYKEVNVASLKRALQNNRSLEEFKKIFESGDEKKAGKFLSDAGKWQDVYRDVLSDFDMANFAVQHMHPELAMTAACANSGFATLIAHHNKSNKKIRKTVKDLLDSKANTDWLSNALMVHQDADLPHDLEIMFNGAKPSMLDQAGPVSDLGVRLGADSVDDILGDIDCGVGGNFGVFDDQSCVYLIKFFNKALRARLLEGVFNKEKLNRVVISVLYSVYAKHCNLIPVLYYSDAKVLNYMIGEAIKFKPGLPDNDTSYLGVPMPRRGGRRGNIHPEQL